MINPLPSLTPEPSAKPLPRAPIERRDLIGQGPLEDRAATPTYKGAYRIGPDGLPTDTRPSSGIGRQIMDLYLSEGQSVSGEFGFGIRSPQGFISDNAVKDLFDRRNRMLDTSFEKRLNPDFDPIDENELSNRTAGEYYRRNLTYDERRILDMEGFTQEQFLRQGTAAEAREFHAYALKMSQMQARMRAFDEDRGFIAGATATVAEFGAEIVTDPTNALALSGVVARTGGKAVAKSVVKAAADGTIKGATGRAITQVAGKAAAIRAVETATSRSIPRVVGEVAALNVVQYGAASRSSDQRLERLYNYRPGVDFQETFTVEGAGLAALMGGALATGGGLIGHGIPKLLHPKTSRAIDNSIAELGPKMPGEPFFDPDVPQASIVHSLNINDVQAAVKNLTGNDRAWIHMWEPDRWGDYERVGATPERFIEFLKQTPTKDEVDRWFQIRDELVADLDVPAGGLPPQVPPTFLPDAQARWVSGVGKGAKRLDVRFESELDKAVWLLGRKGLSKKDRYDLTRWVTRSTGWTPEQLTHAAILVKNQVQDAGKASFKAQGTDVTFPRFLDAAKAVEAGKADKQRARLSARPDRGPHPLDFQTEYSLNKPELDALVDERDKILQGPEPESEANQKRLATINTRLGRFGKAVGAVRKDVAGPQKIDIGVPEAPSGRILEDAQAFQALDDNINLQSAISGTEVRTNNPYFGAVLKWGQKWNRGGANETVFSDNPWVRYLARTVDHFGIAVKATRGALKWTKTIADAKREAWASVAEFKRIQNNVINKYNLSREEMDLVSQALFRPDKVEAFPKEQAKRLQGALSEIKTPWDDYYRKVGVKALREGVFKELDDGYLPVFLRPEHSHKVTEIAEAMYRNLYKAFSADDAPIHIQTAQKIGLVPEGGKRPRPGMFKLKADEDGKTLFSTVSDLPDDLKQQYLDNLATRDINEGALFGETYQAVRRRSGLTTSNISEKDRRSSSRVDSLKARKIKQDVWLSDELFPYVDTDLERVIDVYGDTTAYRVSRQEVVNNITGRRDISWDQLTNWVEKKATHGLDGDEVERVQKAIAQIRNKQLLHESKIGLKEPDTAGNYALQAAADNALNLQRVGVSARSAAQQIISELPQILLAHLTPERLKEIVVSPFRGMDRDQLAGLYYGAEIGRSHSSRLIYEFVEGAHTMYHNNWYDRVIRNPGKRLASAATTGPWQRRPVNVVTAFTHGLAEASRAISLEDYVNTKVRIMQATGERVKAGRHLKAAANLAAELARAGEVDEATFRGLARKAGFGADYVYAARMNQAGLLDPDVVAGLNSLRSQGALTGGKVRHEHLMQALDKIEDYATRKQAEDAITALNRFIESRSDSIVLRPSTWDLRTNQSEMGVYARLANAFLTYGRTWYNRRMADEVGNARVHQAMGILGLALISEFIWMTAYDMLYNGKDIDDVETAWEDNPMLEAGRLASRLPASGNFNNIMSSLVALESRKTAGRNADPIGALFPQVSPVYRILRDGVTDEDISDNDVEKATRLIPGLAGPTWHAVARFSGYKSLGEMITEGFDD